MSYIEHSIVLLFMYSYFKYTLRYFLNITNNYFNSYFVTNTQYNINPFYKKCYLNYLTKIKKDKEYNIIYYNSKEDIKVKYKNVLNELLKGKNYVYWVYNNKNINLYNFNKYRIIYLDFKIIYDYKNKYLLDTDLIENLSKYCYKHKIIFVIISEIHPDFFPNIKYFNKNNLFTPYHYKIKTFGGYQRLLNTFNENPVNIPFSKIVLDIMNRYGVNKEEIYAII